MSMDIHNNSGPRGRDAKALENALRQRINDREERFPESPSDLQIASPLTSQSFPRKDDLLSAGVNIHEREEYLLQALYRLPFRGIDPQAFHMAEGFKLFNVLNHCVTGTGEGVLLRSLIQPSTETILIRSRQEAVKELESSPELRKALEKFLQCVSDNEKIIFPYLSGGHYDPFNPYGPLKRAVSAFSNILNAAKDLPPARSPYLAALTEDLKRYGDTPIFQILKGPTYKLKGEILSAGQVSFVSMAQRLHRSLLFSPLLLAGGASLAFLGALCKEMGDPATGRMLMALAVMATPVAGLARGSFDELRFMTPMRDKAVGDRDFNLFLDSIGRIDEILSFVKYGEKLRVPHVLPTITDSPRHLFRVRELRNPVLCGEIGEVTGNNVDLSVVRFLQISGPNGKGKTTLCQAIPQTQLCAQIGCYVTAEAAEISPADRIYYQGPEFRQGGGWGTDEGKTRHGRFGTELRRTHDIFKDVSPRSLVVFDELAEGTTHKESIEISKRILEKAFSPIGCSVVLITHTHELLDIFEKSGLGERVLLDDGRKAVTGISRHSGAEEAAREIGFSEEAIQESLRRRGYSQPNAD